MRSKKVYYGLDAVRFFAAVIVMLFHFAFKNWGIGSSERASYAAISYVVEAGWVGVPIFFVLSGFVIAFSASGRSASSFVRGRFLRLYPVAWICGTFSAALLWLSGQGITFTTYLATMTLWLLGPWVSGVYWTLAVEIVFYAVVALTIFAFGSHRLPALGLLLCAATTVYLILRTIGIVTGSASLIRLVWFESPTGGLFLLSSGAYFSLGIGLWHTMVAARSRAWPIFVGWPAVLSLLCVLGGSRYHASVEGYGMIRAVVAPVIWGGAVICMAASIQYSGAFNESPGRRAQLLRTAGLMTYPLYLLHDPIGSVILPGSPAPWSSLLVAMLAAIIAAYLVVQIEPRIRNFLSGVIGAGKISQVQGSLP